MQLLREKNDLPLQAASGLAPALATATLAVLLDCFESAAVDWPVLPAYVALDDNFFSAVSRWVCKRAAADAARAAATRAVDAAAATDAAVKCASLWLAAADKGKAAVVGVTLTAIVGESSNVGVPMSVGAGAEVTVATAAGDRPACAEVSVMMLLG